MWHMCCIFDIIYLCNHIPFYSFMCLLNISVLIRWKAWRYNKDRRESLTGSNVPAKLQLVFLSTWHWVDTAGVLVPTSLGYWSFFPFQRNLATFSGKLLGWVFLGRHKKKCYNQEMYIIRRYISLYAKPFACSA